MDSGTKYYYLEGEYVTVIVILLKSIDVTLFVSFIHLFIHCSIMFIMTYDCDWQLYTNNLTCMIGTKAKKKTNRADPGRIAHRDSYIFSLTTRSSEQADAYQRSHIFAVKSCLCWLIWLVVPSQHLILYLMVIWSICLWHMYDCMFLILLFYMYICILYVDILSNKSIYLSILFIL